MHRPLRSIESGVERQCPAGKEHVRVWICLVEVFGYGCGIRSRNAGGRIVDDGQSVVRRSVIVLVDGGDAVAFEDLADIRVLNPFRPVWYAFDIERKPGMKLALKTIICAGRLAHLAFHVFGDQALHAGAFPGMS